MKRIAMMVAVAAIALVPALGNAHGDESLTGAQGYYVTADAQLWQESNGDAGLQRSAHCHEYGLDENGNEICIDFREADSRVA